MLHNLVKLVSLEVKVKSHNKWQNNVQNVHRKILKYEWHKVKFLNWLND
jgi:hypothetical protein